MHNVAYCGVEQATPSHTQFQITTPICRGLKRP